MNQKITGFHQDEEQHWVSDLACGHTQHVRHDPPWQSRPWVMTPEGRASKIGQLLDCKKCDESQTRPVSKDHQRAADYQTKEE
jgi:hypothetical protein